MNSTAQNLLYAHPNEGVLLNPPHQKIWQKISVCADLSITATAFIASYYIRKDLFPSSSGGLTTIPNYNTVLLLILIIWYLLFNYFGVSRDHYQKPYTETLIEIFRSIIIGIILLDFILYFLKITDVSRWLQLIFGFLNIATLSVYKILLFKWMRTRAQNDQNLKNILFIGYNKKVDEINAFINHQAYPYCRIVGCLSIDEGSECTLNRSDFQSLGNVEEMERVLREVAIDEIIFAPPIAQIENIDRYLTLCDHAGATVHFLPDWGRHKLSPFMKIEKINFNFIGNIPAMSVVSTKRENDAIFIKYIFDYFFAALLLWACLPLFIMIIVAIKFSSKGPIFFVQERVGLHGRKFNLYKFRTMVPNAEKIKVGLEESNEADGPVFKMKNDPRIIPYVGSILRKTGLDELPQLLNILRGEMSLVGPRPPIQPEVDLYDFWQRRRLSMKPGITCLWQVKNNRNDISFNQWMKLDLAYIDNWSLMLDLQVILKTVLVVLRGQGR